MNWHLAGGSRNIDPIFIVMGGNESIASENGPWSAVIQ